MYVYNVLRYCMRDTFTCIYMYVWFGLLLLHGGYVLDYFIEDLCLMSWTTIHGLYTNIVHYYLHIFPIGNTCATSCGTNALGYLHGGYMSQYCPGLLNVKCMQVVICYICLQHCRHQDQQSLHYSIQIVIVLLFQSNCLHEK